MTLPALVYEQWHDLVAFLTFMRTWTTLPPLVSAFVVFHQIDHLLFNTKMALPLVDTICVSSPVHELVGPVHQAPLFPMWAFACLPALATYVAEFSSAFASYFPC